MKQYYFKEGETQYGPFSLKEMKAKSIKADTPVWYHPLPKWTTAREVVELNEIVNPSQPAADTAKQYYYKDGQTQYGPFSLKDLRGKNIKTDTPVWYHPLPKWTTAGELPELKDFISQAPVTVTKEVEVKPVSQVVQATSVQPSSKEYYYKEGATQYGPLAFAELKSKKIFSDTPMWYHPLPKWTTAGQVEELKTIIQPVSLERKETEAVKPLTQAVQPATTVQPASKQYYYKDGATQFGPLTFDELKSKKIFSGTPVWYHPLQKWTTAGQVDELKSIIQPTPQIVQPATTAQPAPKQYYYKEGATQYGPLAFEELKGKRITADTPVWYHPLPAWTTAGQVEELKTILVQPVQPVVETPAAVSTTPVIAPPPIEETKVEAKPVMMAPATPVATAITTSPAVTTITPVRAAYSPKPRQPRENGPAWISWVLSLLVLGGVGYLVYQDMEKNKVAGISLNQPDKESGNTGNSEDIHTTSQTSGTENLAPNVSVPGVTVSDTSKLSPVITQTSVPQKSQTITRQKAGNQNKTSTVPVTTTGNQQALKNSEEERKTKATETAAKNAQLRNNWPGYISFDKINYKTHSFGGVDAFDIHIINKLDVPLDQVTIRIDYIKSGGGVHKSETLVLAHIPPNSTGGGRTLGSNRGTKANAYITGISSKKLNFCYPLNNGNPADPYYCK